MSTAMAEVTDPPTPETAVGSPTPTTTTPALVAPTAAATKAAGAAARLPRQHGEGGLAADGGRSCSRARATCRCRSCTCRSRAVQHVAESSFFLYLYAADHCLSTPLSTHRDV